MEGKIYAAMAAVMKDMKAIGKDKRCSGGGNFAYRGIDDVYNTVNPLLAEHDIFIMPEVLNLSREDRTTTSGKASAHVIATVKYSFFTDDGSSVSCTVAGEGMDTSDKATSKALSIAMKYALFQAFCIPTEDRDLVDPDAEKEDLAPKQPQKVQKQKPSPDALRKRMWATIREICGNDEHSMRDFVDHAIGHHVESTKDLTPQEMKAIINAAEDIKNSNPFEA